MIIDKIPKVIQFRIHPAFYYLLTFLFLLVLELNFVGLNIRNKIQIDSTLDFSWFSDIIERAVHGYVLGRDFTFTYGPLFQFLYSLPSIVFHSPSYVSVALAPLISFPIIFLFVFLIAKMLTRSVFERIAYILFIFLILGLLTSSSTDAIKMFVPIVYALLLIKLLNAKIKWIWILIISISPTFVGLYAYNLFITTCLICVVMLLLRKKYKLLLSIPVFIVLFQILFSIIFTGNLDYTVYSLDSVYNFRYVLDLPWTRDRSNILLIFPVLLPLLGYYLYRAKHILPETRQSLYILIFASLIELVYAVSRSDAGHLLWAAYPCIIIFFTLIVFLYKAKRSLLILGLVLSILIPIKPVFSNTLSPQNVAEAIKIIREKPSFFTIYSLPAHYYYTENEIQTMLQFVGKHKDNTYIYPYDSFILNTQSTTFNSFGLGMYTYTNSPVEEKTIAEFMKKSPAQIILGVDTKGALNLDDIPNFTRNPLLAKWIISNYEVAKITPKYLVLLKSSNKTNSKRTVCQIYNLQINLVRKEKLFQKMVDVIKPPIFYLGNIRLPYSPWSKSYLLFLKDIYTANGLSKLFAQQSTDTPAARSFQADIIRITRVSSFLQRRETKVFPRNEFNLTCAKI